MNAPRLVYVGLDTGTIDGDSTARIVDLDAVEYVPDGDDYADDSRVIDLATDHGVPVADLWAAYKREQRIVAVLGGIYDTDSDGEIVLYTVAVES